MQKYLFMYYIDKNSVTYTFKNAEWTAQIWFSALFFVAVVVLGEGFWGSGGGGVVFCVLNPSTLISAKYRKRLPPDHFLSENTLLSSGKPHY